MIRFLKKYQWIELGKDTIKISSSVVAIFKWDIKSDRRGGRRSYLN
jgi:hypothetical protein